MIASSDEITSTGMDPIRNRYFPSNMFFKSAHELQGIIPTGKTQENLNRYFHDSHDFSPIEEIRAERLRQTEGISRILPNGIVYKCQ